jgi:saccharopine dehydrogenase-like NADP-dependent oxidoreductase
MDLADGRDFVANFAAQVDASAKAAGVLAVSGASSVPGLSSAVVDHLSKSLLRVNSISIVGNVPEIPCMATVLLACKLADGELELTGAFPCMGLLKLEEFDAEFQRWDITSEIAEEIL